MTRKNKIRRIFSYFTNDFLSPNDSRAIRVKSPFTSSISQCVVTVSIYASLACLFLFMYGERLGFSIDGMFFSEDQHSTEDALFDVSRELRSSLCKQQDGGSGCPNPASHPALVLPYLLGSLYLFVAIAIVCDEFFVPALEEIGTIWEMSDDIAGATLMAAGGSAPELATSLIGTFSGSDVGFGTIVGSAVFNVLFIIACCVVFTPKEKAPLELTAWPLARDATYYCITLIFVAVMFGINTPGVIEAWEAVFLFFLYIGYCVLMAYNEELHHRITGKKIGVDGGDGDAEMSATPDDHIIRRGSITQRHRIGLLSLVTQGATAIDEVGVKLVAKTKGDVRTIFDQLDEDKNGALDSKELKTLFQRLCDNHPGLEINDEFISNVMKELDIDNNGLIDYSEFTVWYLKSEQRLLSEQKRVFDEMDPDKTGFVAISRFEDFLKSIGAQDQFEEAKKSFSDEEAMKNGISWEQFVKWYEGTPVFKEQQHEAELAAHSAEGIWADMLDFPKEDALSNFMYILLAPIMWPLALTCGIRDVRVPGNEEWCYYQFFASIAFIGGYAYVLVDWVTVAGATLGIPAVVMGLTILAAGTSVPDLLSSIVVARAGKGDMAVSSSIGSNIFDVTVGLPVPWILFNIIMDCPVVVGADNLFLSLVVLLGMVFAVVISIMWSQWKMNFTLGAIMLVLYVIFVAQDVIRVYTSGHSNC